MARGRFINTQLPLYFYIPNGSIVYFDVGDLNNLFSFRPIAMCHLMLSGYRNHMIIKLFDMFVMYALYSVVGLHVCGNIEKGSYGIFAEITLKINLGLKKSSHLRMIDRFSKRCPTEIISHVTRPTLPVIFVMIQWLQWRCGR